MPRAWLDPHAARASARRVLAHACPLAAAAALAACGSSSPAPVKLPSKPAKPSVTATTVAPTLPPDLDQQVITAYTGYWLATVQAEDARNAAAARAILSRYQVPAGVTLTLKTDEDIWAAGEIAYGTPVSHILHVTIAGPRAVVDDCLDLSHAGVQKASTGAVVGSLGQGHFNLATTLVKTAGRWLVSTQTPVEVTCRY